VKEKENEPLPIPPDLDVDPAWLADMTARKPEFVVRLFSVFLIEEPKRLGAMREALRAGDLPRLKDLAHSLKGAAATLGCLNLREACLSLEQAARSGDPAQATAGLEQVARHMDRVRACMTRFLDSQP
jgi:HPt (histidine-containing phosphotransfer) domain-containing protein